MTGRETLRMFGLIRGIHADIIDTVVVRCGWCLMGESTTLLLIARGCLVVDIAICT